MRFIVDTQVWLWWYAQPEKIGSKAQTLMESPGNEIFLSVASVWEIGIKYSTGKLRLPEPAKEYVLSRIARDAFSLLDVKATHALESASLPWHHKDPFDRLIIAQSRIENLPIMTSDGQFGKYEAKLIPAG